MSKVKRCDRCGKEINDVNSDGAILYRSNYKIGGQETNYMIILSSYSTSGAIRSIEERMLFCDKCKEEFVRFFNAPFLKAENNKREKAKLAYESNMIEYMKKQIDNRYLQLEGDEK